MLLQGNNEKVRMGNAFLQKQLPLFTSGVMCNEGLIDCCTLKPQTSSLGKKKEPRWYRPHQILAYVSFLHYDITLYACHRS